MTSVEYGVIAVIMAIALVTVLPRLAHEATIPITVASEEIAR